MGLDTSHDCWHGPYSSFSRFRDAVAVAAKQHYDYTPSYEGHPHRAYLGWWDWSEIDESGAHPYHDILDVFFVHSDCDGYIFPGDAQPLADKLDALVGYMDDQDDYGPNYTHRAKLRQFVAGLRAASDEWEVVRFH